jgi:hypothetical protein
MITQVKKILDYVKNLRFEIYGSKKVEPTEPTKYGKIIEKITDSQIKKILLEEALKPDQENSIRLISNKQGEVSFALSEVQDKFLGKDSVSLFKNRNKFDEEIEDKLEEKIIKVAKEIMKDAKLTPEENRESMDEDTDIERKMMLKLIRTVGRSNITSAMKDNIKKEADKLKKIASDKIKKKRQQVKSKLEKEDSKKAKKSKK